MYAATAVVALGADRAAAQAPFPPPLQAWGPAVAVKDIDPAIRAAAEVLGVVRTRALVIGQVNLPEYVGKVDDRALADIFRQVHLPDHQRAGANDAEHLGGGANGGIDVLDRDRRAPGLGGWLEGWLGERAVRAERDDCNRRRRIHAFENRSHDASLLFFQVKSQLSPRSCARQLAHV